MLLYLHVWKNTYFKTESGPSEASIPCCILQALEYQLLSCKFINSVKIMSNNIHVAKRNPC